MSLQWEFDCPSCHTRFVLGAAPNVSWVSCPVCHVRIPVAQHVPPPPAPSISSRLPPLQQSAPIEDDFLDDEPQPKKTNWLLWGGLSFLGIWTLVIGIMLMVTMVGRRRVAVAPAPAPAPVAATPAPSRPPLFEVNPSPTPPPTSAPTSAATTLVVTEAQRARADLRLVPRAVAITDADVQRSIVKGIDFLLTTVDGDELSAKIVDDPTRREAHNALLVYTLLHCSQSIRDERISINSDFIKRMIAKMKSHKYAPDQNGKAPCTYARSLRASALAIYDRPEDREAMPADVEWLVNAARDGAYTYDDSFNRPPKDQIPADQFPWDNSNSQYGVLGVWNGAESGAVVPAKYWLEVEKHWVTSQQENGMWAYHPGTGGESWTMSIAGIMCLSITRDYLEMAGESANPDRPAGGAALDRALKWLETGDNAINVSTYGQTNMSGYGLYGLERAALASGMMYPGSHDLYRELAMRALREQLPSGAFNDREGAGAVVETSFHLLFLARGRNAVMVNKLRHNGNWNNHPRDLADLTRWASYATERPVNWQIVRLNQPWNAWLDCPILYISGTTPPTLTQSDLDKLRQFALNGGLIFTHADYSSHEFNDFAENLARQLFPNFEMQNIPPDDDLFTMQFRIEPPPELRAVSNGSRRLLIHSPEDITGKWRIRGAGGVRSVKDVKPTTAPIGQTASAVGPSTLTAFQFGVNLFSYASGRSEPRSRLESPFIPAPQNVGNAQTIPIARLKYAGNFDPEPAAWERFTRYFWYETGWRLAPMTTPIEDLKYGKEPWMNPVASDSTDATAAGTGSTFRIAHLTGTTVDPPSTDQAAALRAFVESGGTLIVDACGGSRRFVDAFYNRWIPAIKQAPSTMPAEASTRSSDGNFHPLADTDPILTGEFPHYRDAAAELTKPLVRPYTAQVIKPSIVRPLELRLWKGRIIFSELDITTGLVGTNIWGINGYSPAYAEALMKNLILSTEE
jgi:hypothetical protein